MTLDMTPKSQVLVIDNLTSSTLRSFGLQRTIKKVKRQPTEWEVIFTNHISYMSFFNTYFQFSWVYTQQYVRLCKEHLYLP